MKIDLLEGAQLCNAEPCPIPNVNEETLKTEADRLVTIGVEKHKKYFRIGSTYIYNSKKQWNYLFHF